MSKNVLEAKNTIESSALEQIRTLELNIARRIAVLMDEASQAESNAQEKASEIINSAKMTGEVEAERQYQKIVSAAQSQAQTIIEEVHQKSQYLHQQQVDLIKQVTQYTLRLLSGSEEDV